MSKLLLRKARKYRIRKRVSGTIEAPRLSVFRSNMYIYAQLIDDQNSRTIACASDVKSKKTEEKKTDRAFGVGEKLAQLALKANVKKAVFDRSGYRYHGRVKALAEGARKGGLDF